MAYGLAPGFFNDYDFKIINKTIVVGNPIINTMRMKVEGPVRVVRNKVLGHERAHQIFERVVDAGRMGMEKMSEASNAEEETFSAESLAALAEHYRTPNAQLAEIAGRTLPDAWGSGSLSNAA